MNKKMV